MFQPIQLGAMRLEHRVVMAPLTRLRATDNFAPGPTAVDYYSQRASRGGLLITEAVPISPETPNEWAPGIYTPEQEEGWKKVVDAVHAKGGLISIQLWHTGRVAHQSWGKHPLLQKLGRALPTVSSSATPLNAKMLQEEYPSGKMVPPSIPRALGAEEIRTRLVDDYRKAAQSAKRAGFDCVEIHSAHGYLLNQFMCDGVNKRTDEFGGSIPNRLRALHEVVRAVIEVYGNDRVAVRISPTYKDTRNYYDCGDSNPEELYREAVKSLDQYKLAYLLLSEPRWTGGAANADPRTDTGFTQPLRNGWAKEVYTSKIIGAGGFTPKTAADAIEKGVYDCVAFGRWFISNPDLPAKLKAGTPLNIYDRTTFYIRDPIKGYLDYPFASASENKYSVAYPTMNQADIGQTLAASKSKL